MLYDKNFTINQSVAGQSDKRSLRGFVPLKGAKVQFNGSTQIPTKNRLYLLLISDIGTSAYQPTITGALKYKFKEV